MTKCRYMISYSLYSHHLGWIIWFINLPPISGLCFLLLVSYPPGFVSSRVFVSPWFRILPVWFLSCWFLFFTRRLSGLFLRPRDFAGFYLCSRDFLDISGFIPFPVSCLSWFRFLPGFVSFLVSYPSWFCILPGFVSFLVSCLPGFVSFSVLYPSWFRILPGFVSFPVLYPSWFHAFL